jgi:hypothetical protein
MEAPDPRPDEEGFGEASLGEAQSSDPDDLFDDADALDEEDLLDDELDRDLDDDED